MSIIGIASAGIVLGFLILGLSTLLSRTPESAEFKNFQNKLLKRYMEKNFQKNNKDRS